MEPNDNSYAPFTEETFQQFTQWLNSPEHKNRWLFDQDKWTSYRNWLIFPDEKPAPGPEQQHQYNQRHDALTYFFIKDGKLFQKGVIKDNIPGLDCEVVWPADIFYKIRGVHNQLGHAGINKATIAIWDRYYGITRSEVEWLLKHCQTCLLSWQNRSRVLLKPIVSDHTLQRIQIDLVDMRHEPDGQFK
ncbi:hypothetical protein HOY80DRAFT_1005238 [Tuber brumale]|nr:hypothetical protein HOY80DRAFT_1005238 [Tuber brumale]